MCFPAGRVGYTYIPYGCTGVVFDTQVEPTKRRMNEFRIQRRNREYLLLYVYTVRRFDFLVNQFTHAHSDAMRCDASARVGRL